MRDYQYLMKRSGYRSNLDVPGRRALGGNTMKQEKQEAQTKKDTRENPEKREKYAHPVDRPAVPAMTQTIDQESGNSPVSNEIRNEKFMGRSLRISENVPADGRNLAGTSPEEKQERVSYNAGPSTHMPYQKRSTLSNHRITPQQSSFGQANIVTLPVQPALDEVSGGLGLSGRQEQSYDMMYQTAGMPDMITNPMYTPGYLRTQIGKLMQVAFYMGDATTDRTGILTQVGADYLILATPEQEIHTVCDLHSIRYVTILDYMDNTSGA